MSLWLAVGVAVTLAGCATQEPWGMIDMPTSLRGLVETGPTLAGGQTSTGNLSVTTRVSGETASGVTVIPFRINSSGLIVLEARALGPFEGAAPVEIESVLDTGSAEWLHLPRKAAYAVRPWLARAPVFVILGPLGSWRTHRGVIAELRLGGVGGEGGVSVGPVPIVMNEDDRPGRPVLGLGFLRQFRGVIFDWERNELLLLGEFDEEELAGRFPLESHPWAETPLVAVQRVVEGSPFPGAHAAQPGRAAGAKPKQTRIDLIAVEAEVGGHTLLAILDTGGSGDMLAFCTLPTVEGSQRTQKAFTLQQSGELIEAELAAPLLIGDRTFHNVHVYRVSGDERESPTAGFPDVALGNLLLRRCTLWIDFEERVVRFGPVNKGREDLIHAIEGGDSSHTNRGQSTPKGAVRSARAALRPVTRSRRGRPGS